MTPTFVLLAAGLSTRFGRVKQLEPVGPGGEALLDYSAHDALMAGFHRAVLIVREELLGPFEAHIRNRWPDDLEVIFHHQKLSDIPSVTRLSLGDSTVEALLSTRRKPWGTAQALLSARHHLSGPFVVMNADDFYGPAAHLQSVSLLKGDVVEKAPGKPSFGLVAYKLDATLYGHGGVSRGVCEVSRQGWLDEIEEVLDIRRTEKTIVGRTMSGEGVILAGDEMVSTNFWAFTPDVFPLLEVGFGRFLETVASSSAAGADSGGGSGNVSPGEPEFLIPTEINRALTTGDARVRVMECQDDFFGITHPEDREWVAGKLAEMAREGLYTNPLWA